MHYTRWSVRAMVAISAWTVILSAAPDVSAAGLTASRTALTVAPQIVATGAAVQIKEPGFGNSRTGSINLNDGVMATHFTTGRNGAFGLNWTVPAGISAGAYTLVARTSLASASVPLEVAAAPPKPAPSDADVSVTVDHLASISVSQLEIGVTHTQNSLDPWGDAEAVARGREVLSTTTNFQNQHIMGWGTSNPEPNPGQYDWRSLDRRIQLMRDTGGTPIITLCCAPDWMKGGAPGTTDWSNLEAAPLPEHYDDFAALSVEVARRYPDVQYFQVWNEMKGFYNASLNRWNYEAYTTLYNQVYDAVKAVRPDALIGGPYVVMDTWASTSAGGHPATDPSLYNQPWGTADQRPLDVIGYWLANNRGADFLAVDGKNQNRDTGISKASPYDDCEKFVAFNNWFRRQTILPIVWSEWYASGTSGVTLTEHGSVMAHCAVKTLQSGAAILLEWQPQGNAAGSSFPVGLWTDTQDAGGGQPTVHQPVHKALRDHFYSGTQLYRVVVSDPIKLTVLASSSRTLLINRSGDVLTVSLNGTLYTLAAHAVRTVHYTVWRRMQ